VGLSDITSNVLTRYKADTSDHKAAIRSLRGEEKKAAQERLAEVDRGNKGLDSQIAMWGKVAVGVGAAIAAYKLANVAMKSYLEDVRLESAAAGANIDRLKKATHGLVEEDKLLEFAGKSMNGVWKLNQSEMERVLQGALALRKTMGVELGPTVDALTQSIAKGNTKALREFGIEAKDKTGVLRELDSIYKGLGGNVGLAGDNIQASGVKIADSFDNIKGSLGRMVIELAPAIEALAAFAEIIARNIGRLDSFTDKLIGVDSQGSAQDQRKRQIADLRRQAGNARNIEALSGFSHVREAALAKASDLDRQADQFEKFANQKALVAGGIAARQAGIEFGRSLKETLAAAASGFEVFGETSKKRGRIVGSKASATGTPIDLSMDNPFAGLGEGLASGFQNSFAASQTGATFGQISDNASGGFANADLKGTALAGKEALDELRRGFEFFEQQKSAKNSMLESIFGQPADVDAHREAILAFASGFDILTSSAGAAYDALISGSGSATAAFKKAIAGGIADLGKQFLVKGLGEAAWAIADVAIGNFPGAAAHAQAAGMFFAGAAVAGVTANAMGYGQSTASAGGASSSGGTASNVVSPSSSSGGQAPIIIYVGAEWAGMSSVDQASAVNRAIQFGKRGSRHIRRH